MKFTNSDSTKKVASPNTSYLEKVFSFDNPVEYQSDFFYNDEFYQVEKRKEWNFKKENYQMNVYLVNNTISVIRDRGVIDIDVVNWVRETFPKVVEASGKKQLYYVSDTRNIKRATISSSFALKSLDEYLMQFRRYSYLVPSRLVRYTFMVYKSFDLGSDKRMDIASSLEEGFDKIIQKINEDKQMDETFAIGTSPQFKLSKDASKEELYKAAKDYFDRYNNLNQEQTKLTDELLHVFSRIKWEKKDFKPIKLHAEDEKSQFYDLFNAVSFVQEDIRGMLDEIDELTGSLEKKVVERTKELAVKEVNLRLLIENTENEIAAVNTNFELLISNTLFDKNYETIQGKSVRGGEPLFDGIEDADYVDYWKHNLKNAFKGNTFKTLYFRNGRDLEITFNPIRGMEKKVIGASFFIKDITEVKATEEKLKEQNRALLKVNQELDNFVYSASHDLRAPLCSLLGLINVTKIQNGKGFTRHLELMEKSVQKMDGFVQEIIDYSMNARLKIESQKIDFEAVFIECFNRLKHLEGVERIKRKINIQQDGRFKNDLKRIMNVFNSVLTNAVAYQDSTKEESLINIDVTASSQTAKIVFKDNGIGIDKKYLDKIFNMFFRANEKSNGSGLGLYIAKQTIDRLNGEISVESELGESTVITIELPSLDEDAL